MILRTRMLEIYYYLCHPLAANKLTVWYLPNSNKFGIYHTINLFTAPLPYV